LQRGEEKIARSIYLGRDPFQEKREEERLRCLEKARWIAPKGLPGRKEPV
jgi:hypothetical protein